MRLFILDYGAGNVFSLANSLTKLGHSFEWIKSSEDFDCATVCLPSLLLVLIPSLTLLALDIPWSWRLSVGD
jgi:hypothetical protein